MSRLPLICSLLLLAVSLRAEEVAVSPPEFGGLFGTQIGGRAATDGRDFLVTWTDERMGAGANPMVMGARVSERGEVLDPEPFVIRSRERSGGSAFDGQHYIVASAWYLTYLEPDGRVAKTDSVGPDTYVGWLQWTGRGLLMVSGWNGYTALSFMTGGESRTVAIPPKYGSLDIAYNKGTTAVVVAGPFISTTLRFVDDAGNVFRSLPLTETASPDRFTVERRGDGFMLTAQPFRVESSSKFYDRLGNEVEFLPANPLRFVVAGKDVLARHFDADGNVTREETLFSAKTAVTFVNHAENSSAGLLTISADGDIYIIALDGNGDAVSSPRLLTYGVTTEQTGAAIAGRTTLWREWRDGTSSLMARFGDSEPVVVASRTDIDPVVAADGATVLVLSRFGIAVTGRILRSGVPDDAIIDLKDASAAAFDGRDFLVAAYRAGKMEFTRIALSGEIVGSFNIDIGAFSMFDFDCVEGECLIAFAQPAAVTAIRIANDAAVGAPFPLLQNANAALLPFNAVLVAAGQGRHYAIAAMTLGGGPYARTRMAFADDIGSVTAPPYVLAGTTTSLEWTKRGWLSVRSMFDPHPVASFLTSAGTSADLHVRLPGTNQPQRAVARLDGDIVRFVYERRTTGEPELGASRIFAYAIDLSPRRRAVSR